MIVIVDYKMGNPGSVSNMLKRTGAKTIVSSDPKVVEAADGLILPGVGAFDQGMRNLHETGLIPVLHHKIVETRTPFLGICLGMQLLARRSEEGSERGLGWIEADVKRFRVERMQERLNLPHIFARPPEAP